MPNRFDIDNISAIIERSNDFIEKWQPKTNSPISISLIASKWRLHAALEHIRDFGNDRIKSCLANSTSLFKKLLESRGQDSQLEILDVIGDVTAEFASVTERAKVMDASLTNSKETLIFVCIAAAIDDGDLYRTLAKQIWDPDNAAYIGPQSETCTYFEQDIAYSVKYFLAGKINAAIDRLSKHKPKTATIPLVSRKQISQYVGKENPNGSRNNHKAKLLLTLYEKNKQGFLDTLESYLLVQDFIFENVWDPKLALFTDGLGLARIAIDHGLLSADELPQNNRFFPINLLQ